MKSKLVESKEAEVRVARDIAERQKITAELMGTLTKDKARVMSELLEGVQTSKLKTAFDKYLPAVLTNGKPAQPAASKQVLSESQVVTGNKAVRTQPGQFDNNVIDLKRLAGLK